jgi:hypothetical protein
MGGSGCGGFGCLGGGETEMRGRTLYGATVIWGNGEN